MDTQILMRTAMLAGEMMLCSGAETYRVEDTMGHILKTAENLETAEVLVLMTGITASLKCRGQEAVTMVKRVDDRGTNLGRIVEVNDISRKYCGRQISLEETWNRLEALHQKKYRQNLWSIPGITAGFSLMFGGTFPDVCAAALTGGVLFAVLYFLRRMRVHAFIQDVISSALIAVVAFGISIFLNGSVNTDNVIISAIMPLVPGMAITNAVRDTLQGDYISGAARTLEAFLKAAGIALGVGIGLAVFQRFL